MAQSNVFSGIFNSTLAAIVAALGYTPLKNTTDTLTGAFTATGQVSGATTKVTITTVAALPAAASNGGAVSMVSDASTTLALGLGGTVTGGGANFAPVWCDGTNWRYG